jgi:hypothetical protein
MNRRSYLTAVAGVASLGVVETASAQDVQNRAENETNATATSTPTSSSTETLTQIDDEVALVSWEEREVDADDETVVAIEVRAEAPKAVTLTDAFGAFLTAGVNKVDPRTVVANPGLNRFSERVSLVEEEVGGLGVSTEDGAVGISTADMDDGGGESIPLLLGVGAGAGTGIVGTTISAWRHTRDDMEPPESIDEDDGGLL